MIALFPEYSHSFFCLVMVISSWKQKKKKKEKNFGLSYFLCSLLLKDCQTHTMWTFLPHQTIP